MGGSGCNNGRQDQTMGSHSNYKNALTAFLVPLPSILFYFSFLNQYNNNPNSLSPFWDWCFQHPLLLAHLLFFLNVNVLFWVIGLIQSSHWVCRFRLTSLFVWSLMFYFDFFLMGFWKICWFFFLFSDDWCLLDCDTCDVSALLFNSSSCSD